MDEFDINLKLERISVLEHILLTSKNENEKLEAINQLMKKSNNRAQLAILKALKDKSWRVREKAINSIKPSNVPSKILISYLVNLIDDKTRLKTMEIVILFERKYSYKYEIISNKRKNN